MKCVVHYHLEAGVFKTVTMMAVQLESHQINDSDPFDSCEFAITTFEVTDAYILINSIYNDTRFIGRSLNGRLTEKT